MSDQMDKRQARVGRRTAWWAAVCLACLAATSAGFAANTAEYPAPVVGLHVQDLEPGAPGDVTIAIRSPGVPDLTDFSATSSEECLELGQVYNTAYEVWRLPARLVGAEACSAVVTLQASGVTTEWRGAVLVGLHRVTGVTALDPASGVAVDYGSRTYADDSGASLTTHELTFDNGTEQPVEVLALSQGEQAHELLGDTYLRVDVDDGVEYQLVPTMAGLPGSYPGGVLTTLRPGAARTFALDVHARPELELGGTAVTIALLPLVVLDGATFYVPAPLTSYFTEEALVEGRAP